MNCLKEKDLKRGGSIVIRRYSEKELIVME
jgi:hypothetical protein